jgi:hypothetical protein
MRTAITSACLCLALSGCAPGVAVKLESSSPNAPKWRLSPPGGSASTIHSVGAAEGATERFAVEHAKADATRQLVIKHYGVQIASILQTGQAQKTAGTLEDGKFEGVTAVKEHVIDTITQSTAGTIKGLEVKEIYTERWRDRGADLHKAWVLTKVDRKLMDQTVHETIEKSPTMVEARELERRSGELLLDLKRLAKEAIGAGAEARFNEMHGHAQTVGSTHGELEAMTSRYQALLGRKLPVDLKAARSEHERVKQAWTTAKSSMRVAVHVKSKDAGRASSTVGAVMGHLAATKIPATEGGARCPAETAFWLRIDVGSPVCRRPGMGVSCELSVVASLGRCGESAPLDTKTLQPGETRGAAMDEDKATGKAWAAVTRPDNAALRGLLESLIGRHMPLSLLGEAP